ncbi:MAG: 50S ribosomal protein L18 [Verrucomicrobia bacterium]|nr:50S ribosomal protein L18 [Verrucomicrobiota bacterium]NBU11043.1 50S ribosomal protein L18 [Pseudomonadota bacterium]NDB75079.1 50S ribosomal protein L18 [Verrucomicrobiota bacterium]
MKTEKKQQLRQLRIWRIRKKVVGTGERPRMSVRFTGEHIYVQFIDDAKGVTLATASTRAKGQPERDTLGANVKSAIVIGKAAAEVAKAKGITAVIFDRRGARYHGKVKALADAAREAGLQF